MPTYVAGPFKDFDPTKEVGLRSESGRVAPLVESMGGDVNFVCYACGFTLIEGMLATVEFGQPLGAECPRCKAICEINTGVSRMDPDLGV